MLEEVGQQELVAPPVVLVEQEALEVLEEVALALFADLEAAGRSWKKRWSSGDKWTASWQGSIQLYWNSGSVSSFPSDEFVDFLLVELAPEMLFLFREMRELVMFTAQKLGSN